MIGPRTASFIEFLTARDVEVYTRDSWDALPPRRVDRLPAFLEMIDHHSVTGVEPIVPVMQSIQSYHMSLGWSDFAYSAGLRNLDGSVWLGRGMDNQSGGTGYPEDTWSLCFVAIGNFSEQEPSLHLLRTYSVIRAWAIAEGAIENKGDRDYNATGCPGDNLYPYIPHPPYTQPLPPAPAPEPPIQEDTDMAFLIRNKENKAVALIDAGNFVQVLKDDYPAMVAKFGKALEISGDQFKVFQKNDVD